MKMSREDWLRVKEVVAECLDVEAGEREKHLERACGGDEELRREAASILASHEEAGEFLERPAIGAPGASRSRASK